MKISRPCIEGDNAMGTLFGLTAGLHRKLSPISSKKVQSVSRVSRVVAHRNIDFISGVVFLILYVVRDRSAWIGLVQAEPRLAAGIININECALPAYQNRCDHIRRRKGILRHRNSRTVKIPVVICSVN